MRGETLSAYSPQDNEGCPLLCVGLDPKAQALLQPTSKTTDLGGTRFNPVPKAQFMSKIVTFQETHKKIHGNPSDWLSIVAPSLLLEVHFPPRFFWGQQFPPALQKERPQHTNLGKNSPNPSTPNEKSSLPTPWPITNS